MRRPIISVPYDIETRTQFIVLLHVNQEYIFGGAPNGAPIAEIPASAGLQIPVTEVRYAGNLVISHFGSKITSHFGTRRTKFAWKITDISQLNSHSMTFQCLKSINA